MGNLCNIDRAKNDLKVSMLRGDPRRTVIQKIKELHRVQHNAKVIKLMGIRSKCLSELISTKHLIMDEAARKEKTDKLLKMCAEASAELKVLAGIPTSMEARREQADEFLKRCANE